ncbi:MAG: serine/threonine-protein kinase [Gemmatimonadota bacterium]|nr:serine/threonine-protein kinase [Gemmatimonadota bacterium]
MATGTDDGPIHLPGLVNGRYVIRDIIGRGGAAVVYRSRDNATDSDVALKVLRRDLADSTLSKRFLREIQLAAQLRHPGIVPILDSGEVEGVPYYVMPVFADGTLAQRLRSLGALPFDVVLKVTAELAAALDFAHAYSILHRDVKPQNVLFEADHPLLADFGIARAIGLRDAERLTDSGVVIGTPLYMSPEQAGGDAIMDRRSDVYSLACVTYEMIAGEPPFVAPTAKAVVAKHWSEPVPLIEVVRPTVPPGVQGVLECALAKVPADRYATAGEFARALAAVMPLSGPIALSGRSTPRGPSSARPATRRRHPWLRFALVAVLVAAVVFLVRTLGQRTSTNTAGVFDPHRIAVLYFEDLSPTDVPSYLADAFTETLIDQLSTVPALHVISAAGVRPYRNQPIRVDSIARTLNVGTIISGSVQRTGDSARLAVRLIDAASGQQLYSTTIQRPWSMVFRLQDSLTTEMAFALRTELGEVIATRLHQASTQSQPAWDEAQLASQAFRQAIVIHRGSDEKHAAELMLRADALYARAETLDGKWPLPTFKRATLAWTMAEWRVGVGPADDAHRTMLVHSDTSSPLRWASRALRLADVALRKGTDTADIRRLRGAVLFEMASRSTSKGGSDTLFRAAEASFQAAVAARPTLAPAWSGLANIYMHDGRFADAAEAAQQAYSSDAFFEVRATISLGFYAALYSRRFDEAKTWCDAGLVRYSGDPEFAECRLTLLGWMGGRRPDDVTRAWRELAGIERRDSTGMLSASWSSRRYMVAAIIARAGMRDSAMHVVSRIHARQAAQKGPPSGTLEDAWVRLLLGDREPALLLVLQHLASAPAAAAMVSRSPWFMPLHGDPRFEAAVRGAR